MPTVSGYTRTGTFIINWLRASRRIFGEESRSEEAERRGRWTWKQEGSLTYRVYYLPVAMLHLATSVARSNLISLGTCFGKFSKTGKFKLGITSLDWLAKYAKYKVCQADRPCPFRSSALRYRGRGKLTVGMGKTIWRITFPIW